MIKKMIKGAAKVAASVSLVAAFSLSSGQGYQPSSSAQAQPATATNVAPAPASGTDGTIISYNGGVAAQAYYVLGNPDWQPFC